MKKYRIQEYYTIEPARSGESGFERVSRYEIQVQKKFLFIKWWATYHHKKEVHWEGDVRVVTRWSYEIYNLDTAKNYLKLLKGEKNE